ncbi:hypothetical protein [Lysinibacter sp. HNR]|uniref:hypothetical protein n=1 Tax=Lysinibacter sp. HNR TaxID=3031408 RepID=UPI0024349B21|nr:hypothetical protein [Lysinibacter sp. HNR]WGD37388.1 hypothetical protein FrondiHNR_00245 [Lysinibacter sp. HNR]
MKNGHPDKATPSASERNKLKASILPSTSTLNELSAEQIGDISGSSDIGTLMLAAKNPNGVSLNIRVEEHVSEITEF